MRGRYRQEQIVQHLEVHDEFANCLTGVQKDSLILEVRYERSKSIR